MTTQPAEPPPEEGWTAYEAALAALVVAATVEAGRVFDRLVPPGVLVEEVPDRVRALLVAALTRSWLGYRARAASLASVHAAAWLTGLRGSIVEPLLPPPPSADRDRLHKAAETLLDRAGALATGAAEADPRLLPDSGTAEADLAAVQARRAQEAREALTAARADLARVKAEGRATAAAERAELDAELAALERVRAEEDRAASEALAALERADAAAAAEEARRDAAEEAAMRADDERSERADRAEARARARAEEMAYYAERRARAEQLREDAEAARRAARRQRRDAQRRRVESVARGEVAEGAHQTLVNALRPASEVVGWVRKLDPDPCERCVAWWRSGGILRGPSPARPYNVRMKRHTGCQCVQRPVTQEEANVRGIVNAPEPAHRNKSRNPALRADGTV